MVLEPFKTVVQNGPGCERFYASVSSNAPARAVSARNMEAPHDAYAALFPPTGDEERRPQATDATALVVLSP
jgi:hypothetical protein